MYTTYVIRKNFGLSLPEHFITEHTKSKGTWNTLLNSLITMDSSFYSHVLCFLTHSAHIILLYMFCFSLCVCLVYAQVG